MAQAVTAHTEQGHQCGLAWLATSHDAPLTFPGDITCGEVLDGGIWWRVATDAERADGTTKAALLLRPLGWRPEAIMHTGANIIAEPSDPLGKHGSSVTVLRQAPRDAKTHAHHKPE